MARNDFLTMKTRVLDELHDTNLSSKVGDFVNETIDIILTETNHRSLRTNAILTTVVDQQDYTISSDIASDVDFITSVTTRDPDQSLTEYSKSDFLDKIPDPTNQGNTPWCYFVQNDTISFYPVPGQVMSVYVDYIKSVADLDGDTDTHTFGKQWTDLIVDGAVARGLKYQRPGAPAVWQPQMQMFFEKLKRMVVKNQRKPNQRLRFGATTDGNRSSLKPPYIELFKS